MAQDRKFKEKLELIKSQDSIFGDLTDDLEDITDEVLGIREVVKTPMHFWVMYAVPEFPLAHGEVIQVKQKDPIGFVTVTDNNKLVEVGNPRNEFSSISLAAHHFLKPKDRLDSKSQNVVNSNPDGWELLFVQKGPDRVKLSNLFLENWKLLGMTIDELKDRQKIYDNLSSRGLLNSAIEGARPKNPGKKKQKKPTDKSGELK